MVSDVIDSNANGRNNFFCAEAPEVIAVRFLELKADVDTVHVDTLRYQSTGQQASPGAEALKNCFHYSS